MAAVHFTTIPCEPNTAYKTQGKPNFYNICSCTKDIVYRRFEDFITLSCKKLLLWKQQRVTYKNLFSYGGLRPTLTGHFNL